MADNFLELRNPLVPVVGAVLGQVQADSGHQVQDAGLSEQVRLKVPQHEGRLFRKGQEPVQPSKDVTGFRWKS